MRIAVRRSTAAAACAAAALSLSSSPSVSLAPAADAATPKTYVTTTNPISAAAGWLATQFVDSRLLPTPAGDRFVSGKYNGTTYLNYGENADAIFGLAAAKAAKGKISAALGFLRAHLDDYADLSGAQGGPFDGSVGKAALAVEVAGGDPRSFGGHDLLATLRADECTAASATCAAAGQVAGQAANIYSSISEAFVLLAETRAGGTAAPTPAALRYYASLQCASGGFTSGTTACGSGAADVDATSYAIMALTAFAPRSDQLGSAVTWLGGQQNRDGSWTAQNIENVDSTGLAAAALQGAGADVARARAFLRGRQVAAGHSGAGAVAYDSPITGTTTAATSPSVIGTAQALTGLVDGGGLATVSAGGASGHIPLFAGRELLSSYRLAAGARQTAKGYGFVAGERVRATVAGTKLGAATVSPLGVVSLTYRLPKSLAAGAHKVALTGATSGLSTNRAITVTS